MAHQSLYRRFRPQRFGEIRGQDHVVTAVRNAVREDRVGHAYLFSGPRGTGKTTIARVLAKALNCENLADGEPCGSCPSCQAIESGTSFDLQELDAASNNKVDEMRDLINRAALGSPGRSKVYLLDEVHMLTAGASNALLKTLEEPPPHVVFVLATTDPQKVLPTIRSRTQHFELGLLPAADIEQLLADVVRDAGLDVDEAGRAQALRRGAGSARDALSALEQVVAAGRADDRDDPVEALVGAIRERDVGEAINAVAAALAVGREPRVVGELLLGRLRDAFLVRMGGVTGQLTEVELAAATATGQAMGPAALTRSLEVLGEALLEMRQAPDPRIPLEVALVRLTRVESDHSLAALLERIERLEAGAPEPPSEPPRSGRSPASAARAQLGSVPPPPTPPRPERADPAPVAEPSPAPQPPTGEMPSRDDLTLAWGDVILAGLRPAVKARFAAGRFVAVDEGTVTFALPNNAHRDQCRERLADVESALADHFGQPVPLRLVVDGADGIPTPSPAPTATVVEDDETVIDLTELTDAPMGSGSGGVDKLTAAFPGAELIDEAEKR